MNDLNCKYSNGIVPYMYGELGSSAATEFESHLLDCESCTDEFAALSAARYEVYDWKKLEFDPLVTPSIVIPFDEAVTVSWIEKLRATFAGWAMPAATFAGIAIIVAAIAVFVVSRDGQTDVAKGGNNIVGNENTNVKKTALSNMAAEPEKPEKAEAKPPERSSPRPTLVRESTPRRRARARD